MNLFLRADDVAPGATWTLLDWCRLHGAAEFSLALLGILGEPRPFCDALEARLAPFRLPDAPRPLTTYLVGAPPVQPVPLWRLVPESAAILRDVLDEGLFTYPVGDFRTGTVEDLTVYRDGQLVLGVVSHERDAVVSVEASEVPSLRALGLPLRDQPEWV